MNKKFEIVLEFIKDLSVETKDVETLVTVRNKINNYHLDINITSLALKNKMIEINTKLTFRDSANSLKKSHFEITYASVIKLNEKIQDKKEMEKIILCESQILIYPNLERIFLNVLKDSGFPEIKFEKKIDFKKLYEERSN
tara:strand:- start:57 stop:479 length:423 start_codon:yes stop_codon:yes gene_type:complete